MNQELWIKYDSAYITERLLGIGLGGAGNGRSLKHWLALQHMIYANNN